MPEAVESFSADPTPFGPFFDELEDRFDYPVPLADRIRVGRLLRNGGNLGDLGTLRLALASLLARSPEQFTRFLEAFDAVFEEILFSDAVGQAERDYARWLADLKSSCNEVPAPSENLVPLESAKSRSDRGPSDLAVEDIRPRPSTRERTGLTALRIIPWPTDLERPSHSSDSTPSRPPAFRFDPKHPEFNRLDLGRLGCQRRPFLDPGTLGAVADAMGYFASPLPSPALDVRRSIERSVRLGVPTIEFQPWREVCRVLVLEDLSGERHDWNTVPEELVQGLMARGVPVHRGTFRFSPESFLDGEERTVRLEDLEAEREGLVLLIVSTGAGLLATGERRILEDLAHWPRVAWLEPREERFWDQGTEWVRKCQIPVFEATPGGLKGVAETLLAERGRTPMDRVARHPAMGLREILGPDALPWAAACSLLPRISPSLAESLRREFFSQAPNPVPAHALGRLRRLPGHSWDGEAVQFEPRLAAELEHQASAYWSAHDRRTIARRLSGWLVEERDRYPPDSVAAHVCEALRLNVGAKVGAMTPAEAEIYVQLVGPGGPLSGYLELERAATPAVEAWRRLDPVVRRILSALGPIPDRADSWRPIPSLPPDMAVIPGGPFRMGDPTEEGLSGECPAHEVEVSAFAMGRYPVTNGRWIEVREWGLKHGYALETEGDAKWPKHPVVKVSWHEAVRWCNALSEMEGRRPVYYWDSGKEPRSVVREGTDELEEGWVDWEADGYRLPTEAEWEKAARGGLEGHHYPWESQGKGYERLIGSERANFDKSGKRGTTEVDAYPGNGYGLHDMAGNVWEWCWDWFGEGWYKDSKSREADSRGPKAGVNRVFRGGSWALGAWSLRCAYRLGYHPAYRDETQGFRLSLGPRGIGPGAGATERRRDAEGREGGRRADAQARGCLVVRVPAVEQVRVMASGPGGERMLASGKAEWVEAGLWILRCEAPGYATTRAAVEVGPDEAREVRMALEREVPDGFEWIPGGKFWMGDPTEEGYADERPRHEVDVSEFWMGKVPVTNALWKEVREWGVKHGYELEEVGDARKPDHPVVKVDWYDAVRWCNARSEKEGRRPAYYRGLEQGKEAVYRRGAVELKAGWVDWEADGYRLPTEAEWEKAARGELEGHHYPWESRGKEYEGFIRAGLANYGGQEGGTTAATKYSANGYGLHDMAGNVWEWCWDWLSNDWYGRPEAKERDTQGPKEGVPRVFRGGSWADGARNLRCASRSGNHPALRFEFLGFRLSLGHLGRAEPAAGGEEGRRDDDRPNRPTVGGAPGSAPVNSPLPKKKRIWDWFRRSD